MERNIKHIVSGFQISGSVEEVIPITTGHINDSFVIRIKGDNPGYFLQWVNSYIFKDVEGLMSNIEIVTRHLAAKLSASGRNDGYRVLELIPTLEGKSFYRDSKGEYWRLYKYIPDTHVYDVVENPAIAREGGKAFGRFMSDLADLPTEKLSETIPHFHNMETRLDNFHNSLTSNPANRKKDIHPEISFVLDRTAQMLSIPRLIREKTLPMRITHNDTKFNNILFDEGNHAICIVDLDTVMPGTVLFDFGDAIRTGANTAGEDEKNLSLVDINLPIYEAYARGFISATLQSLTPTEISNLAFSARFMTFIIGLRFLTDFLDGDPYFRTQYPTHNLDRARVQFRLVEAMEKQSVAMEAIVLKACENCKSSSK